MTETKNVHAEWDLVIQPQESLFNLHLQDVWRYRDLLWLLVRRDFVAFYKQTILGPLWFFIQPLLTTIMFTFVFGNLAGISTDGLPQPLFYLAGITAWNYFAECLTKTSTVFKDNAQMFGKVYFPRLIMPLSIVVSNLVRFGVQFLLFLIVMGFYAAKRCRFSNYLGGWSFSCHRYFDGGNGFGCRHDHFCHDHQIPRPCLPADVRYSINDVRNHRNLSAFFYW